MTITLSDELYELLDRLAQHSRRSRDEVFADAVREYYLRHASDEEITEALNSALANAVEDPADRAFRRAATRRTFERNEW
jgi:metal-responsive CopG/Arc/MetJ family transcriptional regulator